MKILTTLSICGIFMSFLASSRGEETCQKGKDVTSDVFFPFNGTNWPELWSLTSDEPQDPQLPNHKDPPMPVDPVILAAAGVKYLHLDPSGYNYPGKSVPWEPPVEGKDQSLADLRNAYNYTYADIITVDSFFPAFWDEHMHGDKTIRYILNGTGYFDLRDVNDNWVRMSVKAGDFMEWPSGIYHRFTVDGDNFITAMRLFKGSPVWTPYPRSEMLANNTVRNDYVKEYLCGEDPDQPEDGEDHDQPEDASSSPKFLSGTIISSTLIATLLSLFGAIM